MLRNKITTISVVILYDFRWQTACKPGFVVNDHLSSLAITHEIERVSTGGRIALCTNLLAADRVYLLRMSPCDAVGSYPTHFTFASFNRGSFVSVALSLGLPPVAVSDCHYPMLPGLSSCKNKRSFSDLPLAIIPYAHAFRERGRRGSC